MLQQLISILFIFCGLSTNVECLRKNININILKQWSIVSVEGTDRLRFLHGLGTNSFEDCKAGDLLTNCFLNAQGRLLFYNRCFSTDKSIKFICEPACSDGLAAYLTKFLFPADNIKIIKESSTLAYIRCLQREGSAVGVDELVGSLFGLNNSPPPVTVRIGDVHEVAGAPTITTHAGKDIITNNHNSKCWLLPGATVAPAAPEHSDYTLIYPSHAAMDTLLSTGTEVWPTDVLETQRIEYCFPSTPREINDKHTALEAGLMASIHFRKGCFVGNEVISKNVQLNAVRQRLVPFLLTGSSTALGSDVSRMALQNTSILNKEMEVIGTLTSIAPTPATTDIPLPLGEIKDATSLTFASMGYLKAKYANLTNAESRESFTLLSDNKSLLGDGSLADTTSCVLWLATPIKATPHFPRFDVQASPAPPVPKLSSKGREILVSLESALNTPLTPSAGADTAQTTAQSAEEQRKAAKLKAMAEKVALLQQAKKNKAA